MQRVVMDQASSHSSRRSSSRMRISSATAMLGWVSLSWNTWVSAKSSIDSPSQRRSTSCRLAEARKYCCCSRSSLPFSLTSLGYSTMVMRSASFLAAMASG